MDLAWMLQNEIEFALLSGQPLTGFALDLSKAYNTISRPVLDIAAQRLGWPVALRKAYAAFLAGVRRHFRVGQHVSPPVLSQTGGPECPLAVVSMIAITWLVSAEVQSKHSIPMMSYVDNWTVQSSSSAVAGEAVACVTSVTSQLAMTVSLTKPFAYATTKKDRGFLRRIWASIPALETKWNFVTGRPSSKGMGPLSQLKTAQGYNSHVANYACGAIVPAQRRKHFACDLDLQPWHIVKVSNHQNWKTAPDEYHAWLWYHNDAAREKAHCAMQTMRAQQKAVYQLQLGVANCFCQVKRAKHISETASVPEDMLQLKMQALGMMLCDAGIKFPGSDCEPVWQRFLLCAPFGQLLFEWFRSVEWVWDPGGFSLLEMYYAFTGQTGWLVPLNLAAWSDEVRPGRVLLVFP
ncbi:unnamed protein product [Symbiodinium natans]|uniref:Reverse transcriptase domain-containing protein n=1 Tax=Symbiodinium natans TaxID=878477 RepID=A0A812LDJ6_9DINO|nr:unnamed protein product [Symbiodinium natans]